MDTSKKVRICANLDDDQHRKLKADCALKGVEIGQVLVDLVGQYLSGEIPPSAPIGSGDDGGSDPLCTMVRKCCEAGEPWRTAITAVVISLYDKMRRGA